MVIGIIGGIPVCAPACTAGIALVPLAGNAAAAGLIDGAMPVQADGTDNAPTETAFPIPADAAEPPPPSPVKPVKLSVPVFPPVVAAAAVVEASSPCATEPTSAPVVAALAEPLPPIMNIRMSMLMGIIAIRTGMLRDDNDDSDDSDDVEDEEDVVDAADARSCSACGVAEISCGPADMTVSACMPAEVPAA